MSLDFALKGTGTDAGTETGNENRNRKTLRKRGVIEVHEQN